MSYQALARQYRPKNFTTLVGQEHVVRALVHALDQKRLHHAYLLTGTRGVGKTTLARIFAKALNCERGVTSEPCGVCDACVAIDAGRFVDYIEMDAASNRGVDEMAQLLEQAVYAPSVGRFKVYMIDEVHMLTHHAFNAMLKTLEEPPAYIKFVLATTDPQKIPVTVLSRCLQFNLKQMPYQAIVPYLEYVLGKENIPFESPALRLLAKGAQGSMRDALSLTDQAIAYCAGEVTLSSVQAMLGVLDQSYLIEVLYALAKEDGPALLLMADHIAARGLSFKAALQGLAVLLHHISVAQCVPSALSDELPEYADIMRLATLFDAEHIQLFYQIVIHGQHELHLSPDDYAGFSMTLLRLLAFRPVTESVATLLSRVSAPERLESAKQAVPVSQKNDLPAKSRQPWGAVAPDEKNALSKSNISPARSVLAILDKPTPDSVITSIDTPLLQEVPSDPFCESKKKQTWDGNWPTLAAYLPLKGVVKQLALQSQLLTYHETEQAITLHLRVPVATLLVAQSIDKLTDALCTYFKMHVKITTEIGEVSHTAHTTDLAARTAIQKAAEETIEQDTWVQQVTHAFEAVVVPGTLKPHATDAQ